MLSPLKALQCLLRLRLSEAGEREQSLVESLAVASVIAVASFAVVSAVGHHAAGLFTP
jgi:hypothetical protein